MAGEVVSMISASRTKLKPNAIVKQIERPLFNKEFIISRSRRIDTSGDIWQIGESDPIVLNWEPLGSLPSELISQIKYTVEHLLVKLSPNTVMSIFEVLKRLSRIGYDWEEDTGLPEQLSDCVFDFIIANRRDSDESDINHLRRWYRISYHLGLSLFERTTCQVLSNLKFKGNLKGLDVMIYIKDRSPLHFHELSQVRQALTELRNRITPYHPIFQQLVITWLYVILGVRPKQLLLLMTGDFSVNVDVATGNKSYMLNVPSVKKRYELPRTRFKQRFLPHFIGEMLEQHIRVTYGDLFSMDTMPDTQDKSLFKVDRKTSRRERQATWERFENVLSLATFSQAPGQVIKCINELRVTRNEAEIDIKLTPRRLRKTFATYAASMGASAMLLMDLLDHDDLQHVMVYYQLGVNFALRVDDVYKKQFSDHIAYFEGKITLKELVERNDIHTVFAPDSMRKLVGIGLCAKGSPCQLQPPYSCYGCNKFEASNDVSVHQEVLTAMQNEVREKFGEDAPPGFFAVQHIEACNELVRRLEVEHE